MNDMNDINAIIQQLMQAKQAGKNPQLIMQTLMQQNPEFNQLFLQFQNMTRGSTPKQFITQFAKQSGLNEQSLESIIKMFSI